MGFLCPRMNLSSVGLLNEDQMIFNCSMYVLSILFLLRGVVDSNLSGFVLELGPTFQGSMVELWESTSHSVFQIMCNSRMASLIEWFHSATLSNCVGSLTLR